MSESLQDIITALFDAAYRCEGRYDEGHRVSGDGCLAGFDCKFKHRLGRGYVCYLEDTTRDGLESIGIEW